MSDYGGEEYGAGGGEDEPILEEDDQQAEYEVEEPELYSPGGSPAPSDPADVIYSGDLDAAEAERKRKKAASKNLVEDEKKRKIDKENRSTTPYMTKYERARVLGTRALQISLNAPVFVDTEGEHDPLKIAMKELREKKVPLIIRRYLPDGFYEDWTVEELL